MMASICEGVRVGLAHCSKAAMPTADGTAALVPKNVSKPGTDVEMASAAASCGFCRTTGDGSGALFSSRRRVLRPRELKSSTVSRPGSAALTAATAIEPVAEAASGLMASELVACSATEKVPGPRAMYFMNGEPVPAYRWMRSPTAMGPPVVLVHETVSEGSRAPSRLSLMPPEFC